MNVSPSRPRLWTPQTIVFAVLLHAAVLYYVMVAFQVVPPPIPIDREPPHYTAVRLPPPTPEIVPDKIIQQPRVVPRHAPPPIVTTVPPLPFPPQPAVESTANATVVALNREMEEQPVTQPLPVYPRMAQERDVQGRVIMSITILPDGSVQDVQVVNAQPRGYFESSAIRAVQRWRYRPSSVTRTNVIVHMDFVLKDA
jgi:protein TonB